MPKPTEPFLSMGGTITLNISTAPIPVQVATGEMQGVMLTNLSTNTLQVLISQSSATTMSTLSTAALTPGILLSPSKQITVSAPPGMWVAGMTTATTLVGVLGVSPGQGMI